MNKRLVTALLVWCVFCLGCARLDRSQDRYSFSGTWIKKLGVFGENGDMYLFEVDPRKWSLKILYHDVVGHTLEGAISPNGKMVLINAWDRQQDSNNLYLLNLTTGVKERLSTANGEEDAFVWIDDSNIVYRYTSHVPEEGTGWNLYRMNVISKEKTLVRSSQGQKATEEYYYGEVAVSRDRRYLAYTRGSVENFFRGDQPFHNGLYLLDLKENREQLVFKHDAKTVGSMSFSPDGRNIAFTLWESETTGRHKTDIVLANLATGESTTALASSQTYYEMGSPVFIDQDRLVFLAAPQGPPTEFGTQAAQHELNVLTLSTGTAQPIILRTDGDQVRTLHYIKTTWR